MIVHTKQLVGLTLLHCALNVYESVFVCMRHNVHVLLSVCRLQPEWVYCMQTPCCSKVAMSGWMLYGQNYANTAVNTAYF